MAVLQKIRQRSLLLILVIGFCLLAFIVGDLFNKGGFKQTSKDVGSINGKDISFEEFRIKVSNVEKSGQNVSATQAANRVWEQEIAVALLTAEFEKLGLRVGENHIIENLKQDQSIGQNPMFLNAAGKFDIAKFREFMKSNPEQAQMIKDREKDAALNAKYQIYSTLVKASSYTTEAEGKLKYEMESNKANFDYVSILYSSIKDSDVKISDAELVDYMKKNEKKYKAEEARELEYVVIEDKASESDITDVKTKINSLLSTQIVFNDETKKKDTLPSFQDSRNTIEFVNSNSDIPYDSTYIAKKDLPAQDAEALFNLPYGQVYGPYTFGNYYCVTKSMGRKNGANVKASHILISYEGTQVANKKEKRTKEEAKAKAEMLYAQVKANPSSLMMLALMNSDDSSAQQGGDLGYFGENQMVKPFNDFAFSNPVGKVGLVETDFGYHIISITDKQDAVRLATVAQKIEPSETTSDKIFNTAVKFEMDANEKDFAKVAKDAGLMVNPPAKVKLMDEGFGSVGNQRQIVRWAYDKETNVGDVKRFEVANVGNVIVKLKKVYEEGLMSIADARLQLEPMLKNKKKAEMIKAKMKGSSLDAIAKANNTTVQQSVDMTLENASLPGVGPERKVVGTVFALGVNKISAPIDGISGVYVVKATAINKGIVLKDHADYVAKLKAQTASFAGRIIPALKVDAKIEDNRAEFNY
ncbi:MAG: peptidylprolyl isomerase [Bacteroidota bacterium]